MTCWKHTLHGYNRHSCSEIHFCAKLCVHKFCMAMVTNQYTENKLCKHNARIIHSLKDYCILVQSELRTYAIKTRKLGKVHNQS